jgi:hypothetical protein
VALVEIKSRIFWTLDDAFFWHIDNHTVLHPRRSLLTSAYMNIFYLADRNFISTFRVSSFQCSTIIQCLKSQQKCKAVPQHMYEGTEGERMYSSYSFMTSALEGDEGSVSWPGHILPPEERTPSTHCTGGWVGPRAGLDTEGKQDSLNIM